MYHNYGSFPEFTRSKHVSFIKGIIEREDTTVVVAPITEDMFPRFTDTNGVDYEVDNVIDTWAFDIDGAIVNTYIARFTEVE